MSFHFVTLIFDVICLFDKVHPIYLRKPLRLLLSIMVSIDRLGQFPLTNYLHPSSFIEQQPYLILLTNVELLQIIPLHFD